MLKIRLSRTGKRNNPNFRIVITNHTAPVKSGYIEHIGHYNPQTKEFSLDKDKYKLWTDKGAKPSDTLINLLVREKMLSKDNLVRVSRKPKKKEKEKEKKEEKEKPKAKKEAGKKTTKGKKDIKEKSKKVEKK